MRKALQVLEEQRMRFTGVFVRYGQKTGWKGSIQTTILLKDIKSSGKVVADHAWFNLTMEFMQLEPLLHEGTVVEFHARVKEYVKGYRGYREDVYDKPVSVDYKLSHPTKLRILPECENKQAKQKFEQIRKDMEAGKLTPEGLGERVRKVIAPPVQKTLGDII